jgi:CheY-like chemotaxis protein
MNDIYVAKMENSKTVLIVEDSDAQRLSLHKALEIRGFRVYSAATVATARELADQVGNQLDVMVLDMRLEDPAMPAITGADIGIEVGSRQKQWPPEFLIHSAFEEVDYYRQAFRLSAAAYLRKEGQPRGNHQLIRHVRVLALRRGLSLERPGAVERIKKIAEASRNQTEAVVCFSRQVLAPKLSAYLGAPFAIFLTDEQGAQCCASNADLPVRLDRTYETIQALAQGASDLPEPFVLETNKLRKPENLQELDLLRKLDGSSFLSLSIGSNIRLSIGILRESRDKNPLAEDPQELSKVLTRYLQRTVMECLLILLSQWKASDGLRIALLKATAQACLYISQQQEAILSELADTTKDKLGEEPFHNLSSLAQGLRQTGDILAQLVEGDGEGRRNIVHMRHVLEMAKEELIGQLPGSEIRIDGDCEVQAEDDDLFIAASRIIEWFAHRPIDEFPIIRINCANKPEGAEIVFEDQSRRLPKQLREQLFFPFTQAFPLPSTSGNITGPGQHLPLFLSKTLVEVKNRGLLEDRSDDIEGKIGHRFVMHFPSPEMPGNQTGS